MKMNNLGLGGLTGTPRRRSAAAAAELIWKFFVVSIHQTPLFHCQPSRFMTNIKVTNMKKYSREICYCQPTRFHCVNPPDQTPLCREDGLRKNILKPEHTFWICVGACVWRGWRCHFVKPFYILYVPRFHQKSPRTNKNRSDNRWSKTDLCLK